MWTRPAPCDVTFTSRWRQRSERIEPRTYSADASVDHTSITPKRATTSLAASVDPTEARKPSMLGKGVAVGNALAGVPPRGRAPARRRDRGHYLAAVSGFLADGN